MMFLRGCVTANSEPEARVTVKTACPELVKYDRETQTRIVEELERLPEAAF